MPPTDAPAAIRLRALLALAALTVGPLLGACNGGNEPSPGQGGEGTDVNTDLGSDGSDGQQSDLGDGDPDDPREDTDANSGVDSQGGSDGETQNDAGET